MAQVSDAELKSDLTRFLNEVSDGGALLVVTRETARSVVMIAEDEYDSLVETLHLLRSPANASRLLRSIGDADAGRLSFHPNPAADIAN